MDKLTYAREVLQREIDKINKDIDANDDAEVISELVLKRKSVNDALLYIGASNDDLTELLKSVRNAFVVGLAQQMKSNLTVEYLIFKADAKKILNASKKTVWEAYKAGRISAEKKKASWRVG